MLAEAHDTVIASGAVMGAAIITGPIVYMLKKLDRRNTTQHAVAQAARTANNQELHEIRQSIDGTREDVGEVREHLVDHMKWHAHSRWDDDDRSRL